MRKADITRDRLLDAARAAFWEHGYSSVALRDIAADAGVDVALVSRYFGGKRGLFEAALAGAFDWPELFVPGEADPVGVVVAKFADPARAGDQRSAVRMILMNATDPEVGGLVRDGLEIGLLGPLRARMGGEAAAPNIALFVAVILGAALVRQDLALKGVADQTPAVFTAQLQHLIDAALSFRA